MDWTDEAIILNVRPHGEGHAVACVFTGEHGAWNGLVFGGAGRRMSPILQPGNRVRAQWRGRTEDALGHFSIELLSADAAKLMGERLSLTGLSAACAVASACLPEREVHQGPYEALKVLISTLEHIEVWPALMARWELGLLSDIGFGLTLDRCAATGARDELIYVSPKSASAVSASAGEAYKDRLLPLPGFLGGTSHDASLSDAIDGLTTTGHFIETRILHLANKTLPDARIRVIDLLRLQLG